MSPYEGALSPYEEEIARLQQELLTKQARSAELGAQVNKPQRKEWSDVISQAALTLLPAVLGTAISGKEGGLVGFQAGRAGGDRFLQSLAEEQAKREALLLNEQKLEDLGIKGIEQQLRGTQSKLTDTRSKVALQGLKEGGDSAESKKLLQWLMQNPAQPLSEDQIRIAAENGIKDTTIANYRKLGFQVQKATDSATPEQEEAFKRLIAGKGTSEDIQTVADNDELFDRYKSIENLNIMRSFAGSKAQQADLQREAEQERQEKSKRERSITGAFGTTNRPKAAETLEKDYVQLDKLDNILTKLEESVIKGGNALTGDESAKQYQLMNEAISAVKDLRGYGAAFTELEAELVRGVLPVLKSSNGVTASMLSEALGRDPLKVLQRYKELLDEERVMRAANLGLIPKRRSTSASDAMIQTYIEQGYIPEETARLAGFMQDKSFSEEPDTDIAPERMDFIKGLANQIREAKRGQ